MGAWPVMCSGKWKKSDACLSAASCASLPFFTVHHWEPRRGRAFAVAFFCLPFLGEARKVSSCRATPGNALSSEENKALAILIDHCFSQRYSVHVLDKERTGFDDLISTTGERPRE